MKTKSLVTIVALLAAGVLTHTQPAAAHSKAKCKFEVFDACKETSVPHSWCVAAAEQQCAGHSHGGGTVNPASNDYTSDTGRSLLINRRMKLQRN